MPVPQVRNRAQKRYELNLSVIIYTYTVKKNLTCKKKKCFSHVFFKKKNIFTAPQIFCVVVTQNSAKLFGDK